MKKNEFNRKISLKECDIFPRELKQERFKSKVLILKVPKTEGDEMMGPYLNV